MREKCKFCNGTGEIIAEDINEKGDDMEQREEICECQTEIKIEEPLVLMDDDGNFCAIIGTKSLKRAEKALRKAEIEWYGENHEEEPLKIEDFYIADIYSGKKKGSGEEGMYYWGIKPKDFFEGKYETEIGFLCNL